MTTILIPLQRDQARAVQQNFCPYLERYCETKIRTAVSEDERLIYMIIRSLFLDVYKMICKKLLTDAKHFKFKLTEAEAIAMYKLLIALPIQADQFWYCNLRQTIIDIIHSQLQQPSYHEPNPTDYMKEFEETIGALKQSLEKNFGSKFTAHIVKPSNYEVL